MEEQVARRIADALERIATAVEGIERAMPDGESVEELARRVMRAQQERARR